jgi:hypothetical protein
LTDVDGHKIDAPIHIIQSDRLIWDLLYNGIRHSIAKGAELKGTARNYFHPDRPQEPVNEQPPGATDQPGGPHDANADDR